MPAPASRPELVVLVAGTGTGVGKTWVTADVARLLAAAGLSVSARKPVQSFGPDEPRTDADVLAAATADEPTAVCPWHRWYPVAMAPPMAADVLGRAPFTVADLVAELRWRAGTTVGLVESVGGVRSPLAADGDTVDLAVRLAPDAVVLVADAGLGTINAVRLSADALRSWPMAVVLNRFDPALDLHRRNRQWLSDRDGLAVMAGTPEVAAHLGGLAGARSTGHRPVGPHHRGGEEE